MLYPLIGRNPDLRSGHAHRDGPTEVGVVHAITGTDYVTHRHGSYRAYMTLCGLSWPADDDSDRATEPAPDQSGTYVGCRRCRARIAAA